MPVYNNICRCGGTGRRTGLKILRGLNLVPVRFRPSAPKKSSLKTTLFLDEIKGESINGRKK